MIELHGVSPASKLYEVIGTKPGLADGQCQPLRPVPCQPRALLIILVLCADAIYIKPPNPEKPGLTLLAQPAFSLAEKRHRRADPKCEIVHRTLPHAAPAPLVEYFARHTEVRRTTIAAICVAFFRVCQQ